MIAFRQTQFSLDFFLRSKFWWPPQKAEALLLLTTDAERMHDTYLPTYPWGIEELPLCVSICFRTVQPNKKLVDSCMQRA